MKGYKIKTLYLIRHAKSDWSNNKLSDFERGLKKRAIKDIEIMGSYLSSHNIKPDLILSSSALRAQLTADQLGKKIDYTGPIYYMKELYLAKAEIILNVLKLQDDQYKSIFLIGHNPGLTELASILIKDDSPTLPTLGILAIHFDNMDAWSQLTNVKGNIDFFIRPKQFK